MTPEATLDLAAYFARIDYRSTPRPDANTLSAIHIAHATHIPFENLNVLLGKPPQLDLLSIQDKLVRSPRGGYCFEQNMLLAAVLEQLGFRVTRLAARVWFRATNRLPRTHMLLRVDLPDGPVMADVGFGSEGLFYPIPLIENHESPQFLWAYRLRRLGQLWMLQARRPGGWIDLYEFTEEPQFPVDYEPLNHFVATHPTSRFVQTLVVSLLTPETRMVLRNRELTIDRGETCETGTVSDAELPHVLRGTFGIQLPEGTRIPMPPGVMS